MLPHMKRRHFIQSSSAGALGALFILPGVSRALDYPSEDSILSNPDSLTCLHGKTNLDEIGRAYRDQHPHEDDQDVLREKLLSTLGHDLSPASLKNHISLDFEEGHVVQIKGWVLSITEARQCALHSILF